MAENAMEWLSVALWIGLGVAIIGGVRLAGWLWLKSLEASD